MDKELALKNGQGIREATALQAMESDNEYARAFESGSVTITQLYQKQCKCPSNIAMVGVSSIDCSLCGTRYLLVKDETRPSDLPEKVA